VVRQGVQALQFQEDGGHDFAQAITTTDTFPKEVAVAVPLPQGQGVIGGVAKGAGMIHPDMATLLVFLSTDLAVERDFLSQALRSTVDASFNMITVDGDNSTNDAVLLMANGMAGNAPITADSPLANAFQEALAYVCVYLAKCVARDGEGATKLIEIQVKGAQALHDARVIARTVAGSLLVKAAVYGNDPNWGRVLAAAGRAGAPLDPEKVDVYLGPVCLMRSGQPQTFDREGARHIMAQKEVVFRLDLHLGEAQAAAWGCDLTEEYVHINAHYTT
jgi:glutamate N-acetyltransferase/amino-acid N-acetyltransferase